MIRLALIVLALFLSFSTHAVADRPSDSMTMLNKGAAFMQSRDCESAKPDATGSECRGNEHPELYEHAIIRTRNKKRADQRDLIAVGSKDAALEAMVQRGEALELVEYEENISSYPLYCSAAYYDENQEAFQEEGMLGELSADGAKIKIADSVEKMDMGEATLLTVSPSGEASVYSIASMLAVCKNNEMLVITPNYVRGAQNEEYAPLTYKYYSSIGTMLEQDSVVWSPDERYFALTFPNRTLIMSQFLDLILVDTKTGDLFVAEATPKKFTIDGCQTAICACFDESGQNVYYLVYGQVGTASRCGIKKYNLATGSVELLCETYDTLVDRPRLFMDDEGNIRSITDAIKADQHAGTILFSLVDGKWQYTVREFKNSMQTQLPVRYLYSNNSKIELAVNRLISSAKGTEMYLTINTDLFNNALDNTAIMLPVNGNTAEIVNVDDDFTTTLSGDIASQTSETAALVSPWMNIQNAVLSPDGYFALIQASDGNQWRIFILDLISLNYIELNLPHNARLVPVLAGSTTNRYRMDWLNSDKVMIPTNLGNVVYYLGQ